MVKSDVYLKIPRTQPVPDTAWQASPYPLPVQSEEEPAFREFLAALLGGPTIGSTERGNKARDWRVKLSAFSGGFRDDYNYLGVHPDGLDGYDPRDIPDAGTMNAQNQVLLYAQHDGWGREAGRYCVDIQSAIKDRQHRWDLTLKTLGLAEPVTLFWQAPPAGWRLTLVDNSTGKQWDMSRSRGITLPSGDGERPLSVLARRIGPPL
jgi:hypothetical protein